MNQKKKLDANISQTDIAGVYNSISKVYDFWGYLTESKAGNRALELAEVKNGQRILEVAVVQAWLFMKS
jgi:ubiquinone/menaquinone biosynthesis C-methylase UbiE